MKFKSQDDEIQYWKLKNRLDNAQIELLEAKGAMKEFENSIDYEK